MIFIWRRYIVRYIIQKLFYLIEWIYYKWYVWEKCILFIDINFLLYNYSK